MIALAASGTAAARTYAVSALPPARALHKAIASSNDGQNDGVLVADSGREAQQKTGSRRQRRASAGPLESAGIDTPAGGDDPARAQRDAQRVRPDALGVFDDEPTECKSRGSHPRRRGFGRVSSRVQKHHDDRGQVRERIERDQSPPAAATRRGARAARKAAAPSMRLEWSRRRGLHGPGSKDNNSRLGDNPSVLATVNRPSRSARTLIR